MHCESETSVIAKESGYSLFYYSFIEQCVEKQVLVYSGQVKKNKTVTLIFQKIKETKNKLVRISEWD